MTLVLNLPMELEAELREVAEARGVAVEEIVFERLKAPSAFDESYYGALLQSDPLSALDYVLSHTPDHRAEAGLPPLTDEQVSRAAFYED
jgi:hypothetical protein